MTVGAAVMLATLSTVSAYAVVIDPTTELGIAGPGDWAVLDEGNFSISNPNQPQ